MSKIRSAARFLLTLDEDDETRLFQGQALIRRLIRLGLLNEDETKLDYALALTLNKLMERRLQTKVYKMGFAKSVHHARVLIKQGHIRIGKQIVNVPSCLVRTDSEGLIDFSVTSPFGEGRPGRVARRNIKNKAGKGDDDDE